LLEKEQITHVINLIAHKKDKPLQPGKANKDLYLKKKELTNENHFSFKEGLPTSSERGDSIDQAISPNKITLPDAFMCNKRKLSGTGGNGRNFS
jgi:hypothetical protein